MIKRDSKGRFKKGSSNAWNKGLKGIFSEEELERRSKLSKETGFKKGNKFWDNEITKSFNFKKGRISEYRGIPRTREVKEKIRKTMMSNSKLRKQLSERMKETRKKIILPKKDTSIEVKIQNFLKELGIDFFTHQYMKIEHGYQCDILIPSMNLVIECDGDYWHKYPVGNDVDHFRTKELIEKGFKVLRLWENEIRVMDVNRFQNKLRNIILDELGNNV